jgi:hypothetical protein
MKKTIYSTLVIIVLVVSMSFTLAPKAKLYPEIEKFYKSLSVDQIPKEHSIPRANASKFL